MRLFTVSVDNVKNWVMVTIFTRKKEYIKTEETHREREREREKQKRRERKWWEKTG